MKTNLITFNNHTISKAILLLIIILSFNVMCSLKIGFTQNIVEVINVDNGPNSIAINTITNNVYVANLDSNTITVINGSTNKISNTISVNGNPWAIDINEEQNIIYVTIESNNTVSVISGTNNEIIKTIEIGNSPRGIRVNSITQQIYIANFGSTSISVIDGKINFFVKTISVGSNPIGVEVNTINNKIYTANSGNDSVTIINGSTGTVDETILVGFAPQDIAFNSETNLYYISTKGIDRVMVIDATTNDFKTSFRVGDSPIGIAVNPANNRIYVTNSLDNTLSVIDGASNTIINTIDVGSNPLSVVVNSLTSLIYVANSGSNNVTVLDETGTATTSTPTTTINPSPTPSTTPNTTAIPTENTPIPTSTPTLTPIITSTLIPNITPTPFETTDLKADFQATPTSGSAPLVVQFTDKSLNLPTEWNWQFGDGNLSAEQNPIYTYENSGIFSVTLTVRNETGADSLKKDDFVIVNSKVDVMVADFSPLPSSGIVPLEVRFTDLSEPQESIVTWLWELGDGTVSTEQNPVHEYEMAGFYTVKLTLNNFINGMESREKVNIIHAIAQGLPIPDFIALPETGEPPLSVRFIDFSKSSGNLSSWIWSFGDGAVIVKQNPDHVYRNSGIYTVSLTVSGNNGVNTIVKHNFINIRKFDDAPIAMFRTSEPSGLVPLKVFFTDASFGEQIDSWNWDFGDGTLGISQNPVHIYTEKGAFTVKLKVKGAFGEGEIVKELLINAIDKDEILTDFNAIPLIGFEPLDVQFVDHSVGNVTSWLWDFGDGVQAIEQNPFHIYKTSGEYDVTLIINNGIVTFTKKIERFIRVLAVEQDVPQPGSTPNQIPFPTSNPQPGGGTPVLSPGATPLPDTNNRTAKFEVVFDPNPVRKSRIRAWKYSVLLKETGGVNAAITSFKVESGSTIDEQGDAATFEKEFDSCGSQPAGIITAFDTACNRVVDRKNPVGSRKWTFFGVDANGNEFEVSGVVTLLTSRRQR